VRKARNSGEVSSLEMLLDTMCNTFGCLIFLAILLAVISQQVGKVVVEQSAEGNIREIEWQQQSALIAEIQARIRLNKALLSSESAATEAEQPNVGRELRDAIQRLEQEINDVQKQLDALAEQRSRQRRTADELQRQAHALKAKQEHLLQDQNRRVKRKFSVPRLHDITRQAAMYCGLRNRKFYTVTKIPPTGLDPEEVKFATGANGTLQITLRPDAGIQIAKGTAPTGKLKRLLQELDPGKVIVNFLVYEDSFAQFQEVKKLFLTGPKRFEYNWKPLKKGEPIILKPVKEIKGGTVQ